MFDVVIYNEHIPGTGTYSKNRNNTLNNNKKSHRPSNFKLQQVKRNLESYHLLKRALKKES